jgi:hypothetical protein
LFQGSFAKAPSSGYNPLYTFTSSTNSIVNHVCRKQQTA